MPDALPPRNLPTRRIVMVLGTLLVGSAAGLLAIDGIAGSARHARADSPCASALETAKKIAPLATGEVAALTMATKPLQLPDLAFVDGTGQPKKLSDWKGRTVLLNLWATWCVPCRKEMPALDNLEGKLGSDKFAVVAVNIDTRNPEKPKAFLRDGNLTRLGNYTDAKAQVFQDTY